MTVAKTSPAVRSPAVPGITGIVTKGETNMRHIKPDESEKKLNEEHEARLPNNASLTALLNSHPSLAATLGESASRIIEHLVPNIGDAALFHHVIADLRSALEKTAMQTLRQQHELLQTTFAKRVHEYSEAELVVFVEQWQAETEANIAKGLR
jgi:hypothetical protein